MWKKNLMGLIGIFGMVSTLSSCALFRFTPTGTSNNISGNNNDQNNNNNSLDIMPPVAGNVYFSQSDNISITLSWDPASDNVTIPSNLQYKVVKALSADTIDTVTKADVVTGDDLLMDWTSDTTTLAVSDLIPETTYYFAVLVKDEAGNKSLYLNPGWSAVRDPIFGVGSISVAVSPNDTPYIAYNTYDADWNSTGITVEKLGASGWEAVGDLIPSSDTVSIVVAPDNTPYIVYTTYDADGNPSGTIEKLGASGWEAVGDAMPGAYNMSIVVAPDNTPYITYLTWALSDDGNYWIPTYFVEKLGASSWEAVGDPISTDNVSISIATDNTPYIAYITYDADGNPSGTIEKLGASGWEAVGDAIPGVYNMSIKIASNNTPYVAYITSGADGNGVGIIEKLGASSWEAVGDPISSRVDDTSLGNISIIVAPDNTPYIACLTDAPQGDQTGTVEKLGASGWETVGDPISKANNISIAVALDGASYITYYTYDSQWNQIGTVEMPALVVPYFTLAAMRVARPSFSLPGGMYETDQTVIITDATPGAVIRYTTDGTNPLTSQTAAIYSSPISVTGPETVTMIRVIAVKDDMWNSDQMSCQYIIYSTPTFNMVDVAGGLTFPTGIDDSGTATVDNSYQIANTPTPYILWYFVRHWAINNGYTFANPGAEGNTSYGAVPYTLGQPVIGVSWYDALIWTNALTEYYNSINGTNYGYVYKDVDNVTPLRDATNTAVLDAVIPDYSANGFRLPTSNEYELAARYIGTTAPTVEPLATEVKTTVVGGTTYYWTPGTYASGATDNYTNETATQAVAWDYANGGIFSHPVARLAPNALDLYDMSGCVWEWTFDGSDVSRVTRGGSWNASGTDAYFLQVGYGANYTPSGLADHAILWGIFIDFRFVRTAL